MFFFFKPTGGLINDAAFSQDQTELIADADRIKKIADDTIFMNQPM